MDIRKIGAAAGFAAGAAFALAPLASADVGIGTTVDSEITMMNSLFDTQVLLSGFPASDITTVGGFDVVPLADAPQTAPFTPLDYFLYGVNPAEAGPVSDPGSYELLNGALGKFDDAYNVLLYSALNNGAIDMNDADFIGSASSIDHAQGLASATDAFNYFLNFGVGDLEGYLGIFPGPDAGASTALVDTFDFTPYVTSEIESMNTMFGLDASLANIPAGDIIHSTGDYPWDTLATANTNDLFNTLVFGLNPDNVSPDIGAYDLLNGALGQFDNAYNVALFSLLDPTGTFDPADIIGTHADFLEGGALSAISEFFSLGVSDLLGYFDPTNLFAM